MDLQHARPPHPSPCPEVCQSSYSLHWWCHPAISSSNTLFSFYPQPFPASGTFLMSQLFSSDDQNTGVSASVLPVNIQVWSPLRLIWFDLLAIQGTFRSLLQHHSSKVSILWCSAFFPVLLSQLYMTAEKTINIYWINLMKKSNIYICYCVNKDFKE